MGVPPLGPTIKPGQRFGENPTQNLPPDHPLIREFGNYQPNGHSGEDYPAAEGTPVYATEDGTVTWAGPGELLPGDDSHDGFVSRYYLVKWAAGNVVAIEHTARGGYVTLTYHLKGFAPGIKPGVKVKRGQLIGYCGTTGRSTGPHAHIDVIPTTYPWGNGFHGRVNPAPYLADPWPTTPPKEPILPNFWVPGAVRRPQPNGVGLNTSLPPRAVWHITSDVDPGRVQPAFRNVANYLMNAGYCPHLMWDPVTGYLEQYYPANVGARALAAWNEDGRYCFQIEVLFSAGAIRDGRRYEVLADTPLKGYGTVLAFLDQLGIPRRWPMGPPPRLHTNSSRNVDIWNTQAGHYGHVHVPNNDHTDPGIFPPLTGIAPPPAPPKPDPVNNNPMRHWVVDPGDTMAKIAKHFGTTVADLAEYNGIKDPSKIKVKERIWPRDGHGTWTVEKGDTLYSISRWVVANWKVPMTVERLRKANGFSANHVLRVGDRLQIPKD